MKRIALLSTAIVLAAARGSAATFTVINTNPSGPGSLLQALIDAEAAPGADDVAFDIPGAGPHTIAFAGGYDFTTTLTIDGYTQPGSQPNTNATGGLNSVIQIELVCGGARCFGVVSPVTIRGIAFKAGSTALDIAANASATIAGNYFGTDASGMVAGTLVDGISSFPQGGGASLTIGGTQPADRNLISGNQFVGIRISSNVGAFISATIQGNVIGLARDGVTPLPNGLSGIDIQGAGGVVVGGIDAGEANLISGNGGAGVAVGTTANPTTIRGNSIFNNGGKGIQLSNGSAPLPNDPTDADDGGNDKQNFPIIQSVGHLAPGGGSTEIVGKLDSKASTTYDLDFYDNSACASFPREFLEGKTWIGTTPVTTDASGHATFDVTFPVTTEPGARISATATDPAGNTSEFSQRILFSISPASGPSSGGSSITLSGTDFADPTTLAFGGTASPATFVDDHTLTTTSPALPPGTVNDVVATTPDGTAGTLVKGWVSDFLDVPGGHQFYAFVTTLVSNGITVGVGGGNYGVDQPTLRQQMAVFLLKGKHGLCYVPPACGGTFADVPCPSTFADWIEALAAEGITGGCGGGNYCPASPVRRDQMAVFLLKAKHGSSYTPPACTGVFPDVACPSTFADWIEQLAAENITGGCGNGNYCPLSNNTRGQMAVFITKTFNLQ